MKGNKIEKESRNEFSAADELRMALKERALSCLLQGDVGASSLRQLFINEYINYIGLIASNPHYSQKQASELKNYDLRRLKSTIRSIFQGIFLEESMKKSKVMYLSSLETGS